MTPSPQSSMSTPALAQNAFDDQQQTVPTVSTSSSLRPSRNRPLADQHQRRLQATTTTSPTQQLQDATRLSPATLDRLRTLEHEYESSRLSGMDPSMPTTPKKGSSRRGTDIEFATEIGQGLLIEVRKLRMLLQEKDQMLKEVLERKADLERDADMMVKQLRQREEMQEQLKNQTWDLELAKQDLSGNVTELQQSLNRSHVEQSRLTKQLNDVRAELDRMRDREEKLNATIETIKTRHEHDMGVVRRHAAGLQREKLDTKKQMDSLLSELAIARAQSRMMSRPENLPRISPSSSIKPSLSSSTTTAKSAIVPPEVSKGMEKKSDAEQSGTSSSNASKAGQVLEVETLKSSLAHAHRMVSNLRSNLHKEKTEKFELKKLLSESQETIEQLQSEMWVDQPTPRRPAIATMGSGSVSTTTSGGLVASGTSGPAVQGSGRRRRVRRRTRRPVRFGAGGDDDDEDAEERDDEDEETWSEGSFGESDDGTQTPPPLATQLQQKQQQPLSEQLSLAEQLRSFTPEKIDQAIQTDEIKMEDGQRAIDASVYQSISPVSKLISTANALSALDRAVDGRIQEAVVVSTHLDDTAKHAHDATPGSATLRSAQENVVSVQTKEDIRISDPKHVPAQQMSLVTSVAQEIEANSQDITGAQSVVAQVEHVRKQETMPRVPSQQDNKPLSLADELGLSASKSSEKEAETFVKESEGTDICSKAEARSAINERENKITVPITNSLAVHQEMPTLEDPVPALITLLRQQNASNDKSGEPRRRSSSDDTLIDLYIPAMLDLLRRYGAGETPEPPSKLKEQEEVPIATATIVDVRSETTAAQAGEGTALSQAHVSKQPLEPPNRMVEPTEHAFHQQESVHQEQVHADRANGLAHPAGNLTNITLAPASTRPKTGVFGIASLESVGADMYMASQDVPTEPTSSAREAEYMDAVPAMAAPKVAKSEKSNIGAAAAQPIEQTSVINVTQRLGVSSPSLSEHVERANKSEQRAGVHETVLVNDDSSPAVDINPIAVHTSRDVLVSGTPPSVPLSKVTQELPEATSASALSTGIMDSESREPVEIEHEVPELDTDMTKASTISAEVRSERPVVQLSTMAAPATASDVHAYMAIQRQETIDAPENKNIPAATLQKETNALTPLSDNVTNMASSEPASRELTCTWTVGSEAEMQQPTTPSCTEPAVQLAIAARATAKDAASPPTSSKKPLLKTKDESAPIRSVEQEPSAPADQIYMPESVSPASAINYSLASTTPDVSNPTTAPIQSPQKVPKDSSDQVEAAEVLTGGDVSCESDAPMAQNPSPSRPARTHLVEQVSNNRLDHVALTKNMSVSIVSDENDARVARTASAEEDSPALLAKQETSKPSEGANVLESMHISAVASESSILEISEVSTSVPTPTHPAERMSSKLSDEDGVIGSVLPSTLADKSDGRTAADVSVILSQPTQSASSPSLSYGSSSGRAEAHTASTSTDSTHISSTTVPPRSIPCQVVNSTASNTNKDPSQRESSVPTNIQHQHQSQHQYSIINEASTSISPGAKSSLPTNVARAVNDVRAKDKAIAPLTAQLERTLPDISPKPVEASKHHDTDVADLLVGETTQCSAAAAAAATTTVTATGSSDSQQSKPASTKALKEPLEYGHVVRMDQEAKILTQTEADAMVVAALEDYRRKSAQVPPPRTIPSNENVVTATASVREPEQNYGVVYVAPHTFTYHTRRESSSSGISTLTERRMSSSHLDAVPGNSAIALITQTMIGNFMWKYTRKAVGQGLSERRHQRFFWIHPYTRTLYWSVDAPGTRGREAKAKSAFIENVAIIPTPHPDHLPASSLLIKTTGRPIKITAPDTATHDVWFEALLYLLDRSENDMALGRMDVAESLSSSAITSLRRPQLRNIRSTGSFAGSMARRRAAARNFKS